MPKMRRAFVEIVGLRLPPADPSDALERGKRGGRSGRVGGLAVVDEDDAVLVADGLHAVRETGVGAEALLNRVISQTQTAASKRCCARVLKIVGTLEG